MLDGRAVGSPSDLIVSKTFDDSKRLWSFPTRELA